MLGKKSSDEYFAPTARPTAFVHSRGTVHRVENDTIVSESNVSLNTAFGTARSHIFKETSKGVLK